MDADVMAISDEDARKIIADAHRIYMEDRERADYTRLHEKYGQKPEDKDGKTEGNPPPEKTEGEPPEALPKKKGVWWGDRGEE